jgi:pyruvate dehydrogenase E2 component (dihydrolipoamide acetyltransferase)
MVSRAHDQARAVPDDGGVGQGVHGNPVQPLPASCWRCGSRWATKSTSVICWPVVLGGRGGAAAPARASRGPPPAPSGRHPQRPGSGSSGRAIRCCSPPTTPAGAPPGHLPHASPSVRKFARTGCAAEEVKGTGPRAASPKPMCRPSPGRHGRHADPVCPGGRRPRRRRHRRRWRALGLIALAQGGLHEVRPVERKDLSRIKKISGANLLRNCDHDPAVTNHDDADITDLEAFRVLTNKENEKSGVKVTMLAFLIKACVAALRSSPSSTARWTATP